jgi:medium-chain acyl-[acyl-carrier-protein] hydrolase
MDTPSVKPRFTEKFNVRSYDLDVSSRLKISSVFGFFQEVAGKHAEQLGLGYESLIKDGMAWMLSRMYVRFHDIPGWQDELQVETWPVGMERLFFRRDFFIFSGGEKMASASSYWLLINLKKMRPCILPVNEDIIRANKGYLAIHEKMEEIPPVAGNDFSEVKVTYSMLDRNRHVNNTRYADWIMDQIGVEKISGNALRLFSLEYRQQVTPEDTVLIRHSAAGDGAFLVEGIIKDSRKICFRARVDFS